MVLNSIRCGCICKVLTSICTPITYGVWSLQVRSTDLTLANAPSTYRLIGITKSGNYSERAGAVFDYPGDFRLLLLGVHMV